MFGSMTVKVQLALVGFASFKRSSSGRLCLVKFNSNIEVGGLGVLGNLCLPLLLCSMISVYLLCIYLHQYIFLLSRLFLPGRDSVFNTKLIALWLVLLLLFDVSRLFLPAMDPTPTCGVDPKSHI